MENVHLFQIVIIILHRWSVRSPGALAALPARLRPDHVVSPRALYSA